MKKSARLTALVLSAAMLFTACGNQAPQKPSESKNDSSTASSSTTAEQSSTASTQGGEKVLMLAMSDTPETLNPHTTSTSYGLIGDMTATLYKRIWSEEQNAPTYVPAVADGEPICLDEENHRDWRIKLKEGYTFVDGTPITAHVFEYSFKMLNDPKLANRNTNASRFENGLEYMQGKCEWDEVKFKAVDDYTIELRYAEHHEPESGKSVKASFAFVATAAVHPEMYESCLNSDGTECTYGTSLDKFVASGLYEPTKLIEGQFLEITKRTDGKAPLADVFTPDRVEYTCVTDTNTRIQLFEQGKLDTVGANQEAYAEYPGAHYQYNDDVMGIFINAKTPQESALKDPNMRYALYWGLDREKIVKTVFPTSIASAYQYLPFATIADPADKDNKVLNYRTTKEAQAIRMDGHEVTQSGYDKELALEYFEKAYEANGNKKITINMLYSDDDYSKTFSEALQNYYQELFGTDRVEVALKAVPFSIIYSEIAKDKMNYDVCVSCGNKNDAEDPWDNTNWVATGEYTYNTQYCVISDEELSKEWDELYYKCALYDWKWDAQKKIEASARMEEILYNDCSFIPVYCRGTRSFFSQKITPLMDDGHVTMGYALMQAKFN